MFGQMLGGIDTAMLTTRTTETEHQTGETALDVATYVGIGQLIDAVKEGQYLTVILQESDNRFFQSVYFLVRLVATGVVGAATIEHVATAIAALVLGNTLGVREAENPDHQRTLSIVLRERGRAVLRMGLIGIEVGGLVTIGSRCHSINALKLGQLSQTLQELYRNCRNPATRADSGWRVECCR